MGLMPVFRLFMPYTHWKDSIWSRSIPKNTHLKPVHRKPAIDLRPRVTGKSQNGCPLLGHMKVNLNRQKRMEPGSTASGTMAGLAGIVWGGGPLGTWNPGRGGNPGNPGNCWSFRSNTSLKGCLTYVFGISGIMLISMAKPPSKAISVTSICTSLRKGTCQALLRGDRNGKKDGCLGFAPHCRPLKAFPYVSIVGLYGLYCTVGIVFQFRVFDAALVVDSSRQGTVVVEQVPFALELDY